MPKTHARLLCRLWKWCQLPGRSTTFKQFDQHSSPILRWYTHSALPRPQKHNEADEVLQLLRARAPLFPVSASQLQVLKSPDEFFERLLKGLQGARRRATLAALYIGTHLGQEKQLVDALADVARHRPSTNMQMTILLTPVLHGLLKRLLPARFNEVIGVCHLKAHIFDDDVLITGANLSNSYFTNRQDRYMVLHGVPELASYLQRMVDLLAEFSHTLQPSGTLLPPATDSKLQAAGLRQRLERMLQPYSAVPGIPAVTPSSSTNCTTHKLRQSAGLPSDTLQPVVSASTTTVCGAKQLPAPGAHPAVPHPSAGLALAEPLPQDTWVFPLVQVGYLGIQQDAQCIAALVGAARPGSRLQLATAYLNLASPFERTLGAMKDVALDMVTASPQANGFFQSPGLSGLIPTAYSMLAERTHRRLCLPRTGSAIRRVLEYQRPGWEFHAKGLWYYPPGEEVPLYTAIGSPNFGQRSLRRDVEMQLLLLTSSPALRAALAAEATALMEWSEEVGEEVFRAPERGRGGPAMRLAVQVLRTFL